MSWGYQTYGFFAATSVLDEGDYYKYAIKTRDGEVLLRTDPFAHEYEKKPGIAAIVNTDSYKWHDGLYRGRQGRRDKLNQPVLFNTGQSYCADKFLGVTRNGQELTFRVWAPHAEEIHLVSAHCDWAIHDDFAMTPLEETGVWEVTTEAQKITNSATVRAEV
ncbi:hypothetical protein H7R52_15100 [Weissella confusa]|uniref:Glycoside hydrolase family 13 N-terminal domain-containing protein n=1 Tax=Weissella confusa TaxID=1583 RepID=A0A923NKQ0_WEICO|nr:hypothetical protein [Weissella confusa]